METRPEKIVPPAIPPLLWKHRNLRLKASSRTGNHSNSFKSICKKSDSARLKTGEIEYFQNQKSHIGQKLMDFSRVTNPRRRDFRGCLGYKWNGIGIDSMCCDHKYFADGEGFKYLRSKKYRSRQVNTVLFEGAASQFVMAPLKDLFIRS